jgi:hypothetical protein
MAKFYTASHLMDSNYLFWEEEKHSRAKNFKSRIRKLCKRSCGLCSFLGWEIDWIPGMSFSHLANFSCSRKTDLERNTGSLVIGGQK